MTTVTYPLEENNGKFRPFIPIVIINPLTGHKFNTKGLIDTGADSCAFPQHIAKFTNHNLKGVGVTSSVNSGIGGVDVSTWKHTFLIGLLNPQFTSVLKWSEKILVDCFEHDKTPPLLGTTNFLKDFTVKIDYPKKTITLSWE